MSAPERCPYADKGQVRCPPSICDCFWDLYPDDPFGLHPEAFLVGGHARYAGGEHTADCPGCKTTRYVTTDEGAPTLFIKGIAPPQVELYDEQSGWRAKYEIAPDE